MKLWDQDGEFRSKQGEHVLVSRLMEALTEESATCTSEQTDDVGALLHDIYALQVRFLDSHVCN